MIKKTITYEDFNGETRTEDFMFNLSKAELSEMETSVTGGLKDMLTKIIQTKDIPKLASFFKEIILKSYGEKSADGRRFIKSEELTTEFTQTPAYSELYMELATNSEAASEFINGIIPKGLSDDAKASGSSMPILPAQAE